MTTNTVEHFTDMLNARFGLGTMPQANSEIRTPSTKNFRKTPTASGMPIRETITYPRVTVSANTNACLTDWRIFEHVLACGHLINTQLPDLPCAPNCHHVERQTVGLITGKVNGKLVSDKDFFCDACVEEDIEEEIPPQVTATSAENYRTTRRAEEWQIRDKKRRFRKCYIAIKNTSVPCYADGSLSLWYQPIDIGHPLDVCLPRIGNNMFEDINPASEPGFDEESKVQMPAQKRKATATYMIEDDDGEDHEVTTRAVADGQKRKRVKVVSEARKVENSKMPRKKFSSKGQEAL